MSARNLIRLAIALVVLLALWGAVTLGTKQGDVEQRFWVPTTAPKDVDTVIVAGAHDHHRSRSRYGGRLAGERSPGGSPHGGRSVDLAGRHSGVG